jgi:hypothetical protein
MTAKEFAAAIEALIAEARAKGLSDETLLVESTQVVDKPGPHRAGFDADAGIISGVPPHSPLDWIRNRGTMSLAPDRDYPMSTHAPTPWSAASFLNRSRRPYRLPDLLGVQPDIPGPRAFAPGDPHRDRVQRQRRR